MVLEQGDATIIDPAPQITILTHCVNNRGIWGAGFVLAIGAKWPEARTAYRSWCAYHDPMYLLGKIQFVKIHPHLIIAHVVGQDGIGRGSLRIPALLQGLEQVALLASRLEAAPYRKQVLVQMPKIGCGIAGGSWDEVGPLVSTALGDCRVRVRSL